MAYSRRTVPYQPGQKEVYKLSRSKIELFMQCPRCFWLGEREKIKRPSSPPFNINKAIDELYKKEFDSYRKQKKPHPLMTKYKIQAIPFTHEHLDKWRHNFSGVTTVHEPTNLHLFGAVDDVWVNDDGELIVVDYKATSKNAEITLDADWQISYKRQMEIYQWLLRQNDFKVSSKGYFVYTNARMDLDGFDDKLEFRTKVIEYEGSDEWVEPVIIKMKECLDGEIPEVGAAAMGGPCDFCSYARQRTELTLKHLDKKV
ncbi:MAG TPA: PD-(D/E)XK nuclease family protein [Candidatus Saccharimonadales bacterium]|nr:PD-(D/E)XK nuclease family protein [Candidatus Saccharimonadales bacterium]